jgi:hypothetical protein
MSELGSLGIAEENKEQNRYRRQTVIYTIPKMTRAPRFSHKNLPETLVYSR